MGTPWFKFYGADYLSDPKIMGLTACERSCWITLLCYASTAEIPGEIKYLDEYKLMVMAGLNPVDNQWDETKGVLQKLVDNEMITLSSNAMITIKNFRKRQDTALSSYERVKKYREKKRFDNTDNANDNARVEKRRIYNKNLGASPKTSADETKQLLKRLSK